MISFSGFIWMGWDGMEELCLFVGLEVADRFDGG